MKVVLVVSKTQYAWVNYGDAADSVAGAIEDSLDAAAEVVEMAVYDITIRDADGNYIWKSVPTTDWGQKETLLQWRQEWANYVNRELEKKSAPVKIDHRSYKEQGAHQLPTIHEGPTVRAMEKKGIRTEKGNLNRFIRSANALLKKMIARYKELAAWIKEAKENLNEPVSPSLSLLLMDYLKKRNTGAYSDKAKTNSLKQVSQEIVYLEQRGLSTMDDLQTVTDQYREKLNHLNQKMRGSEKRYCRT